MIDYIQLMTASGRFGSRQEEVSAISRSLKGLATELGVPVIALSQLSPCAHGPRQPPPHALRHPRIRRHRAGRGRGDVHPPRGLLRAGDSGKEHRRDHHRQAAQRRAGHGENSAGRANTPGLWISRRAPAKPPLPRRRKKSPARRCFAGKGGTHSSRPAAAQSAHRPCSRSAQSSQSMAPHTGQPRRERASAARWHMAHSIIDTQNTPSQRVRRRGRPGKLPGRLQCQYAPRRGVLCAGNFCKSALQADDEVAAFVDGRAARWPARRD